VRSCAIRAALGGFVMTGNVPALLAAFFTDRLIRQREASPHTVAAYRDSFRLFLGFAQQRLRVAPSKLCLGGDFDVHPLQT